MITTFEAEFGNIKIPKITTRLHSSPTEENEFFVRIWDAEDTIHRSAIPKGTCTIRRYLKVPPDCPHCGKQLPEGLGNYKLQEIETYEYKGVTVKAMAKAPDYDDDVIELRLHYETVEVKK